MVENIPKLNILRHRFKKPYKLSRLNKKKFMLRYILVKLIVIHNKQVAFKTAEKKTDYFKRVTVTLRGDFSKKKKPVEARDNDIFKVREKNECNL